MTKAKQITLRVPAKEQQLLESALAQNLAKDRTDAILKAIDGFYGDTKFTLDRLYMVKNSYHIYLLDLLEIHTDVEGSKIIKVLKEALKHEKNC